MPPLSQGLVAGMPKAKSLSSLAAALGPPPKTRSPVVVGAAEPVEDVQEFQEPMDPFEMREDPLARVLNQQGQALNALISHLAGGDAMRDLAGQGTTSFSSSTRGVQRRERMQKELALGKSMYWLQMQQQMHRRLAPSSVVPKNDIELKESKANFLQYMERFGGFRQSKELGTILWVLGHAIDSAKDDNFPKVKEHLALLAVALEQAALDQDWGTAFLLTLVEDPPRQVFQDRMSNMGETRPFAPLVPGGWAATTLSYLKELEVLSTKKTEIKERSQRALATATIRPKTPRLRREGQGSPKSQRGARIKSIREGGAGEVCP